MEAVARAPIDALQPRQVKRRKPLRFRAALPGTTFGDIFRERPLGGRIRAVRRIILVILWTLVAIPIQAALLVLPGAGHVGFGRFYHAMLCRLIGLRVHVVGRPATHDAAGRAIGTPPGAPVLFLSNHSSWLDILVLGGVLEACFVGKAEIASWPLVSTVARLGRTVFVSRARGATGRETDAMRARLLAGDSLILFPEGTSNDGARVLPFRSALLATADAAAQVQPVSLVYDRLGGLPACRRDRPLFAWYGDMDLATHFWRLARHSGARATVVLHQPFSPTLLPDRKALAVEAGRIVSAGAAQLRQNRPATPQPAPLCPAAVTPAAV